MAFANQGVFMGEVTIYTFSRIHTHSSIEGLMDIARMNVEEKMETWSTKNGA